VAGLPGDVIFIAGGAIPTLYIAYLGIRYTVKRVTLEEPEDILFTEVAEPEGVPSMSEDEATAARLT
jgi:nitric oxide reductase subunit B